MSSYTPPFPKPKGTARLDRDEAETIALRALGFMAEDEDRLGRFMGDTGVSPDVLQQRASSPEILTAVLDFLARDEALLLMFTANADIPPEHIGPALALLDRALVHRLVTGRHVPLPRHLCPGIWLLRSHRPAFLRLPASELATLVEEWPLEGPQTWEQRRWASIGSRHHLASPACSRLPWPWP